PLRFAFLVDLESHVDLVALVAPVAGAGRRDGPDRAVGVDHGAPAQLGRDAPGGERRAGHVGVDPNVGRPRPRTLPRVAFVFHVRDGQRVGEAAVVGREARV